MPKSQEFPQTLHRIIEDAVNNGNSHIISWMHDNTSFRIHNRNLFVSHIMPHYFGSTTIRSFHRQLSHYGFKRNDCLEDGSNADASYYHKFFTRDDKTLLSNIRRKKNRVSVSSKTVTAAASNKKRKLQQQKRQEKQQAKPVFDTAAPAAVRAAPRSSTQPAHAASAPAVIVGPPPVQQAPQPQPSFSALPVVPSCTSNSSPANLIIMNALSHASLCNATTAWPVVTTTPQACDYRVATPSPLSSPRNVIDLLPSQEPKSQDYSNATLLFNDKSFGPLPASLVEPSLSTSTRSSVSSSSSSSRSSLSDQVLMFEQEFPLEDNDVLPSSSAEDPMIDDDELINDVVEWLDNSFPPSEEEIYDDTFVQTSIDFQPNRIFW